MGKMKELFMNFMNENPDMSDAEYQDWLHSQEPATQEDKTSEHDAWWNSLTDEQKQQLCEEQKAMEKERIELSIEEMNHDLSFGK
jgi:hypothetical protein